MKESKNSDTKPKKADFMLTEPAAPDDPIYSSGYVMLRPIVGNAAKPHSEPDASTEIADKKSGDHALHS